MKKRKIVEKVKIYKLKKSNNQTEKENNYIG